MLIFSRFVFVAVLCSLALVACSSHDTKLGSKPSDAQARGKHLVTTLGCGDCHTPLKMGLNGLEPDTNRWFAGHPEGLAMPDPSALREKGPWQWTGSGTNTAFSGPWGITYATNLTPEPDTGLGIWTEEMFVMSIRTGKHKGTLRQILPPMPWQSYSQLSDSDLKSIYSYLRSLPPIKNQAPDAKLSEE